MARRLKISHVCCFILTLAIDGVPSRTLGMPGSDVYPLSIQDMSNNEAAQIRQDILKNLYSAELRRKLFSLYSNENGYHTIGDIYRLSADLLDPSKREMLEYNDPVSRNADYVVCNMFAGSLKDSKNRVAAGNACADRVAEIVHDPNTSASQAVQAAEDGIREHGVQCRLLVEWSRAFLLEYSQSENRIGTSEEELAIRIISTMAQQGVFPVGYESPGRVLLFLSDYFASILDYPSALASAQYARHLVILGKGSGRLTYNGFIQIVEDRISKLERLVLEASSKRSD